MSARRRRNRLGVFATRGAASGCCAAGRRGRAAAARARCWEQRGPGRAGPQSGLGTARHGEAGEGGGLGRSREGHGEVAVFSGRCRARAGNAHVVLDQAAVGKAGLAQQACLARGTGRRRRTLGDAQQRRHPAVAAGAAGPGWPGGEETAGGRHRIQAFQLRGAGVEGAQPSCHRRPVNRRTKRAIRSLAGRCRDDHSPSCTSALLHRPTIDGLRASAGYKAAASAAR